VRSIHGSIHRSIKSIATTALHTATVALLFAALVIALASATVLAHATSALIFAALVIALASATVLAHLTRATST